MKICLHLLAQVSVISLACTMGLISNALATEATRINPADLQYLGAFRVPFDTSNGTSWNYGGGGMSFNPTGDPGGPADGFPGSLFGIGKMAQGNVSEYAIPAPVMSDKLPDLPIAKTLQPFKEITGGQVVGTLTTYKMGDVQLLKQSGNMPTDKLFWVLYEFYTPEYKLPGFGWSNIDISTPFPEGLMRVGNDVASATSRYIFEIPQNWADQYTAGRNVMVGRSRGQMNGSWGPAFFAINPQQYPTITDEMSTESIPLLRYSAENPFPSPGWSHDSDDWNDGAWLSINGKSSVILAGSKGIRTDDNGLLYYGLPGPDGCGDKGYHAEPNYAAILFYDPDDLALVALGKIAPNEVKHYALLNIEKYMYKGFTCRKTILGGVGYDEVNKLLYIEERFAGNGLSNFSATPVIHVWRLVDGENQVLDDLPPTEPSSLKVTAISATEKKITWSPSTDDSNTVYYIVYRNNEPIIMTMETEHIDNKFSLLTDTTTFAYKVEALDPLNNSTLQELIPKIKRIILK